MASFSPASSAPTSPNSVLSEDVHDEVTQKKGRRERSRRSRVPVTAYRVPAFGPFSLTGDYPPGPQPPEHITQIGKELLARQARQTQNRFE